MGCACTPLCCNAAQSVCRCRHPAEPAYCVWPAEQWLLRTSFLAPSLCSPLNRSRDLRVRRFTYKEPAQLLDTQCGALSKFMSHLMDPIACARSIDYQLMTDVCGLAHAKVLSEPGPEPNRSMRYLSVAWCSTPRILLLHSWTNGASRPVMISCLPVLCSS